jgi:hypothetical protein
MAPYSKMIGLQRVFSFRYCRSFLIRASQPTARGTTTLRPFCASTDTSKTGIPKKATPLPEAITFDGLIKQKFLAAAGEITYHIAERSPDPTEAQIRDLETKLE